MEEIQKKAKSGKLSLRGLSEEDMASILDELAIVPSSISDTLASDAQKDISTEVIIGEGRDVKFPLLFGSPIFLDSGTITSANKSIRIASAYGCGLAKTPINIGEGMLSEEVKIAKKFKCNLMTQWSPLRIGIDEDTLSTAKAIVIDLTFAYRSSYYQGEDIFDKIEGKNGLIDAEALGPARHLDIESAEDLKGHVTLLREATEYNIPIMVKIPQEGVYEGTKAALDAECDAVIINTSLNPFSTLTSTGGTFGTTLMGSIPPAVRAFKTKDAKKKGIKLLISGGFRNGSDIVKILALGADAVGIVEGGLIAMGCILCGECHLGKCKIGMATKDSKLRSKFDWKIAGKSLANYLKATKNEMDILLNYMGVEDVRELDTKHIIALTYDAAAICGIKLTGYDRELPMWFH